MRKKNLAFGMVVAAGISIYIFLNPVSASASSMVLKEGMQGSAVVELQKDLKKLGYFSAETTGYYGQLTESAVKSLQKRYGLAADGVAGNDTFALVRRLLEGTKSAASSRSSGSAYSGTLKKGMRGNGVAALQKDLKRLGYLKADATGYYGDLTVSAVKNLQKRYGLVVDGVAGQNTFTLIRRLLDGTRSASTSGAAAASTASRGSTGKSNYLVSWFNGAANIFKIGKVASVYDIDTGSSFKVKRTYGYNHADVEPLTAKDSEIMKKIFGGQWSWKRRAVIVDVDGRKMAASLAGMPHAGSERAAANTYVSSRSGGYGRGTNLDAVKGNNVSGHFDLHFYGSKTHGTNRVDRAHQSMVKKAAEWAKKNY